MLVSAFMAALQFGPLYCAYVLSNKIELLLELRMCS